MSALPVYQPRYFKYLGLWQLEQLQLKQYLITQERATPRDQQLHARALGYIEQRLPAVAAEEGHHHGVGYFILHRGEMASWLLIHWWAHSDIVLHLLAAAKPGQTKFEAQDERRFHGCIWEYVVVNFERDAWVRQMNSRAESLQPYLTDCMADGYY